ncbi:MAG: hypoxanthine phosphoribosyltransferase [Bdellovibrionales bacterium]|nr:hypoxanthine phosphoribosyltransferase [Bdellovibrionales bacterium]
MLDRETLSTYINEEEIQEIIKKLARRVEEDFSGEPVTLICPLKGSIFFIADFMRELKLQQEVDFVQLTNRSGGRRGADIKFIKDISTDVSGKNVIIIEEIIDTARTLSFLKNRLLSAEPKTLRVLTLLDKPARRVISLKPDYIGKTIEDRYVIGYGMDQDEAGRNFREIYFLKN